MIKPGRLRFAVPSDWLSCDTVGLIALGVQLLRHTTSLSERGEVLHHDPCDGVIGPYQCDAIESRHHSVRLSPEPTGRSTRNFAQPHRFFADRHSMASW